MEIGTIIATSLAGIGLILTAISVGFAGRQIQLDRKMRTLDYATNQFDKLAERGFREELRAMGDQDILAYTNNGRDVKKTQNLLQYVYTFNRIGAGIHQKALSEDIIFNIWTPRWFEGHWSKFEPLIVKERARRGKQASGAYVFFEWLAKKKCPKVRRKYPEIDFIPVGTETRREGEGELRG